MVIHNSGNACYLFVNKWLFNGVKKKKKKKKTHKPHGLLKNLETQILPIVVKGVTLGLSN
jgi:hypothetical protein